MCIHGTSKNHTCLTSLADPPGWTSTIWRWTWWGWKWQWIRLLGLHSWSLLYEQTCLGHAEKHSTLWSCAGLGQPGVVGDRDWDGLDDPDSALRGTMSRPNLVWRIRCVWFLLNHPILVFGNATCAQTSCWPECSSFRMDNPSTYIGLFQWADRLLIRFENLGNFSLLIWSSYWLVTLGSWVKGNGNSHHTWGDYLAQKKFEANWRMRRWSWIAFSLGSTFLTLLSNNWAKHVTAGNSSCSNQKVMVKKKIMAHGIVLKTALTQVKVWLWIELPSRESMRYQLQFSEATWLLSAARNIKKWKQKHASLQSKQDHIFHHVEPMMRGSWRKIFQIAAALQMCSTSSRTPMPKLENRS